MLDLKAKLAAAGVVSEKEIKALEDKRRPKQHRPGGQKSGSGAPRGNSKKPSPPIVRLPARLRDASRAEIYEAVRRYVDRFRIDSAGGIPSESAQRFHFSTETGKLTSLFLEPELFERVSRGDAGVVAYMSNHGLAHCVLPAEMAAEIAKIRPRWLRVLKGHPEAGQIGEASKDRNRRTGEQNPESNAEASAPPDPGKTSQDESPSQSVDC